jgi:cytoskeletal protein RodZ
MDMSVREPLQFRKTLLAGAVALALTGTGVAFAWAASDAASPSPTSSQSQSQSQAQSQTAPGQENRKAKPDKAQRPQHLHSESVVKKADGTFATELSQRGTVDAVSATSITVKSEDGYSQTYAVNAETKIRQVPAAAAGGSSAMPDAGKRHKPAAGTIADIAAGDAVRISGEKIGDKVTAERIVEGAGDGRRFGHNRGHGHGKGHRK